MATTSGPPKGPSLLSIFVFGSLTAVLLFAVLMSGLRSDLRAQLGESSHRTHEVAAHVSQAVRMPLRFSANSLTFIAEESNRLHSVAPEQSEVLLKGMVAEIMRRQPQILHIDVVDAAASASSGTVPEVSTGTVWASCGMGELRTVGAPCFGPVEKTAGGEVMYVGAPFDEHRRIVADMQVAALERAVVNVPHANDIFFALEDAQGRAIVQGGDARAAAADANALVAPWWVRHLFGWQGPLPLRATTAIEPYPFKVVAGITYQKALAPWRRQVIAATAFYLFYLFAFASLLGVIYRSGKVQRYYIEHLQAKTQELHTAQRVGRTAIWTFQQGRLACTDEEGEIFGLPGGSKAASVRAFLAMVHPQDRAPLIAQAGAAWRNQDNLRAEFRIRTADGSERSLSAGGKVVVGQDGARFMTGTVVDVTEQAQAHRRQAESEQRFHSLFDRNPLPFWVFDAESLRILEVNAAAVQVYGYTREEFLAMTIFDLRDPGESPGLVAYLASGDARGAPKVWTHRTRQGRAIEVRIHAADIVFNGVPARLVLAEDVGQQLAGERELAYRASHDPVTKLPNQHALLAKLDELAAEGQPFGVTYVQLLGMDAVADTFGINVAAGVLRAMTARLVQRVGGDGFLAAVNDEAFAWVAPRERMSEAALQAVVQCAADPLYFEETQHQMEIVLGVASYPKDGSQGDVLFARAALAAHAHVRSHRSVHYFEPALAQQSKERMQFSASLRRAVRRHEFEMYFQPITGFPDQRLIGLEALMRWPQADGSLIPPSTFIPVCEESGLIVPLGRWVLSQVAKASLQLKEAGFDDLPIGVNISPAELRGSDLVANLRAVRAAYELADHAIHIELTESCLIEHRDKAIEVMRQLRADGVAVALDDFGTGFSSLSYLHDLPIDMLKIDQAFIRGVDSDARSATICDAIIALGKSLGIRVIAEGIERPAQYQWLYRHGCDGAQGFYLGRPERLADFLAQWTPARARVE
ncbi:GGDEF domain-containing phosphodiesterase [Dyella sp. SG609]|uniref:putative bifunctional diguanylate cyclase/phosphodiesterase n=1 Tax=Dyella sp. SG609 TaxID=2587018 RepID=UPI00144593F7|nr:GGDEF domain-containing phosphodiesterase [Dyella sp. SG609]NKJ19565.1 PAS domain S-box-containing protein [Dyella sp. SG609]